MQNSVKSKGASHGLLSGVLLLTVANVFVKILGFFYKVPLNAVLGDEMANVNAAYAIYALLYTVSTAGVPNAVSLSVSRARARGKEKEVGRLLRVTASAFFLVGAGLTALLILLAKPIALFNSGGDSYLCLLAIAPALVFAALNSVLRGYFQGFERLEPTAVSELIEAVGKTLFGLLFAFVYLSYFGGGVRNAAALSVFAITLGTGFSALALGIFYRKRKITPVSEKTAEGEDKRLLFSILRLALPITATAALMSLSSLLDAQLMRPLLSRFYGDADVAKTLYSDYSTGALTLYNLPTVLVTPMSAAAIPFIAAALERGESARAKGAMEVALRAAALISLPCALGMSALASPILSFVFRGDSDMAKNTGSLLSVLALAIFFVAVFTVTGAVLQAAKKERLPLFSLGVGVAVKLVSLFVLTLTVGEIGVPVSTLLFYISVCALNLYFVKTELGLSVRFGKTFLRPAIAAFLSATGAYFSYTLLHVRVGESVALFASIALAVLLYLLAVSSLRCVGREELSLFPFFKKHFAKREK